MYPISLQHILVQTHWFFHVAHWQMPYLKKASSTVFMTLLSLIYILELCNFNYQISCSLECCIAIFTHNIAMLIEKLVLYISFEQLETLFKRQKILPTHTAVIF